MPRKAKDVHTSPKNAGEQNMPSNYSEKHQDDMRTMEKVLPTFQRGLENRENYKGLWTDDDMIDQINQYFSYCSESKLKPCKSGLQLWLGVSRSQYWEWETDKSKKYGRKSNILEMANQAMESSYIERGEKYPTMNMFLLKANHGFIEQNKMDITSNGNTVSATDVSELVEKLGLGKK